MFHDDVPNLLGRVLVGTKYGIRQARGRFGLGAKMVRATPARWRPAAAAERAGDTRAVRQALIWSKMSTGQPVDVRTARDPAGPVTHCVLDIDIYRNEPHILVHERLPNPQRWRGSEIGIVIEGNWSAYRAKVLSYLRQLAIITPFADFSLRFASAANADRNFAIRYARRSEHMPPAPKEVKHHPSSVNLIIIKKLASDMPTQLLQRYLTQQFSSIDAKLARQIIGAPWRRSQRGRVLCTPHASPARPDARALSATVAQMSWALGIRRTCLLDS